ncbi:MAG TPA: CBS domain-containing protein [Gemmatimonadaceae bacterium]|nr:CBS domain-containing protein [Gemmatimonadaceae bacterium]
MPMRLEEIMTPRVVGIAPDAPATAAWTRMRRRGIRHLVVLDDDRLVGVVSERDLGGRGGTSIRRGRSVRSLMTRDAVSAEPGMRVRDAADLMRQRLIGSLPVMDDGRLVGIVTATDVFDALGATENGVPMSRAERQLLRAPASSRRLGGSPAPRTRRDTPAGTRRSRPANRTKREPLASRVPKGSKATLGRTEAPLVPAHIRAMGVDLDPETRAYIRRKLGMKLGKFALAIERVSVRVRDVNGPRGGVDHECQVKVVLSGLPSVVARVQDAFWQVAIDRALTTVAQRVRRSLERRHTTPRTRERKARAATRRRARTATRGV